MRKHEVGVLLGGVFFFLLVLVAWQRLESVQDRNWNDDAWVSEAKRGILSVEGFESRRNGLHARVGEEAWRTRVKPEVISRLTVSTVIDTGEPFPDWQDVSDWMTRNPEKVRSIMESYH